MKYLLTLIVCLIPFTAHSQWREIGRGRLNGEDVVGDLTFGVHGNALFVNNYSARIQRYTIAQGWQHADGGIDYSQGVVTSFASLGSYVYASIDNGPAYVSSSDGSTWAEFSGSPVGSNGRYLFASWISAFGKHPWYVARSNDTGKTWDSLSNLRVYGYTFGEGVVLATTSTGVWRTLDLGESWQQMPSPSSGQSLKNAAYLSRAFYSGDSGVNRSLDSGMTWSRIGLTSRIVHALVSTTEGYLFAGTDSGVFVSMDTGTSWRWVSEAMGARPGHNPDVRMLAVMDSFLYAYVDAGDWGLPDPNGRYSYTTGRPIREMVDTTLGKVVTAPPQIADRVFVYPNPTSKIITIESADVRIMRVDVLNVLGEEILHSEDVGRDARPTRVDLSNFASGSYYLRIETDKGLVLRKFVRE